LSKVLPITTSADESLADALGRKALTGAAGAADTRMLASGPGWRVVDVLCTSGPGDRPFEEKYWSVAISLVLAGTFSYRSAQGSSLMSQGALLLGNHGHTYECSHAHGEGDRCLSFQFDPAVFEEVARDAGAREARFRRHRIPPLRATASVTARAVAALRKPQALEEIALEMAGTAVQVAAGLDRKEPSMATREHRRVAAVLRFLEENSAQPLGLTELAEAAGLSRFHFLRAFKSVTGVTPHQWLLRARLRDAARRLVAGTTPITELALDAGFQDLPNFIRSFRAEFGVSPGRYRASA
jgi:AraC family transcriptional regulator